MKQNLLLFFMIIPGIMNAQSEMSSWRTALAGTYTAARTYFSESRWAAPAAAVLAGIGVGSVIAHCYHTKTRLAQLKETQRQLTDKEAELTSTRTELVSTKSELTSKTSEFTHALIYVNILESEFFANTKAIAKLTHTEQDNAKQITKLTSQNITFQNNITELHNNNKTLEQRVAEHLKNRTEYEREKAELIELHKQNIANISSKGGAAKANKKLKEEMEFNKKSYIEQVKAIAQSHEEELDTAYEKCYGTMMATARIITPPFIKEHRVMNFNAALFFNLLSQRLNTELPKK